MKKKLTAVVLCIAFLFAMSVPAFAATNTKGSEIHLKYVYINDTSCTISANGGTAKVYARIRGTSSVTRIVISTELQRYNFGWSTIASWTQNTYGNSATLLKSSSISSGYYYRAVTTFDVHTDSGVERAVKTSNEVLY